MTCWGGRVGSFTPSPMSLALIIDTFKLTNTFPSGKNFVVRFSIIMFFGATPYLLMIFHDWL